MTAEKSDQLPPVPLTLEGSSILHQMMKIRRPAWNALTADLQAAIVAEAQAALEPMERGCTTAMFSMLGHKGDLMLVHFRRSFEELNDVELRIAGLKIGDFLESSTSYLSVVELGLYESSVKLFTSLAEKGAEPGSPEWDRETEALAAMQRKAMEPRLWPEIPSAKFVCFYPMDRKRSEVKNWYTTTIRARARMMHQHGMSGRKYAGQVKQIISGSIGFDDWEWGVDLFADDPLVFKRLVYEMRFDEGSAIYALFGPFYIGRRFPVSALGGFLNGRLPA
jgi:hydrogen peroxide-dependent heme synthase